MYGTNPLGKCLAEEVTTIIEFGSFIALSYPALEGCIPAFIIKSCPFISTATWGFIWEVDTSNPFASTNVLYNSECMTTQPSTLLPQAFSTGFPFSNTK